ncbi:MAG: hypothetical protein M0C28_08110 [Candidatus Moduliflexus flocculans]|nr:hypothetical protein [Candidatus Moduliflexus flocculans]
MGRVAGQFLAGAMKSEFPDVELGLPGHLPRRAFRNGDKLFREVGDFSSIPTS